MHIGSKIREARKTAGIKQKDLAAKAHITVRTLQWYESGDRMPPAAVLYWIAQETKMPLEFFYQDDVVA